MSDAIKNNVQKFLRDVEYAQADGVHGDKYENVFFGDEDLVVRLEILAARGPLTLDHLDGVIAEIDAEFTGSVRQAGEMLRRCAERRDDLKVFYVINTADNRLTVLAKDSECARHFAYYKGHLKDQSNGRVMVLKPEHEAELRRSGKALGRALRDGYPGVVTEMGDSVVMEDRKKVYTPMTIVN